jgi:hypothetical protein
MLLVFENEFEVYRILDHHTRWKSRDGDLVCLESEKSLAVHEPVEQDMSGLQELDRVAQDRQSMWWSPEGKKLKDENGNFLWEVMVMDTYFNLWPLRCMLRLRLKWLNATANRGRPRRSRQSMPVGTG